MSVETNNYKLTKDSSNDFYNIKTLSDKTHNHNGVYEPVINKKTGFNLDKSDSLTHDSTNTLATSKAINSLNDKLKEVNEELEENSTVEFETGGATVTSFPSGAKGLFSPVVEGMTPITNEVALFTKDSNNDGLADGIAKWSIDACDASFCNGVQIFIAKEKFGGLKNIEDLVNPLGRKYYIRITFKADSNKVGLEMANNLRICHSGNNKFETKSTVFTHPNKSNRIGILDYRVSDWTKVEIKNWCVYDVTDDQRSDEEIKAYYDQYGYKQGFTSCAQCYELESSNKNKANHQEIIKYIKKYDANYQLINEDGYNCIKFKEYLFNLKPLMRGEFKPDTQYTFKLTVKKLIGSSFYLRIMYVDAKYTDLAIGEGGNGGLDSFITKKITSLSGKSIDYIYFSYGTWGKQSVLNLDTFEIVEGTKQLNKYIPNQTSNTAFSVGEDTPLIELPNGAKNKVLDNGDYEVNVLKKEIKESDVSLMYEGIDEVSIARIKIEISFNVPTDFFHAEAGRISCKYREIRKPMNLTTSDDIGYVNTLSGGSYLDFVFTKGTTLTQAKDKLVGLKICYQVPRMYLKDGQQGYKAPQPINIYKAGDCVLIGTHTKRYQLTNSTTINLSEEIEKVAYIKGEIDGEIQELEYTLTNSNTITLNQTYTGDVNVKGYLSSSSYINPNIKGRVSASLGDMAVKTAKEVADLNEHLVNKEANNDILLHNHDTAITTVKADIKSINNDLAGTKKTLETSIQKTKTDLQTNIGDKTQLQTTNKTDLVSAINEVKQSGSDFKNDVATAITAMGVATNSSDNKDTFVNNIKSICTGKKWAMGNCHAENAVKIIKLDFTPCYIIVWDGDDIIGARLVDKNSWKIQSGDEIFVHNGGGGSNEAVVWVRICSISEKQFIIDFTKSGGGSISDAYVTWLAVE